MGEFDQENDAVRRALDAVSLYAEMNLRLVPSVFDAEIYRNIAEKAGCSLETVRYIHAAIIDAGGLSSDVP